MLQAHQRTLGFSISCKGREREGLRRDWVSKMHINNVRVSVFKAGQRDGVFWEGLGLYKARRQWGSGFNGRVRKKERISQFSESITDALGRMTCKLEHAHRQHENFPFNERVESDNMTFLARSIEGKEASAKVEILCQCLH